MCFKPKLQHELFNILGGNLQKVDATSQKDEGYEDLQRCFSTPSSQGNLLKGNLATKSLEDRKFQGFILCSHMFSSP